MPCCLPPGRGQCCLSRPWRWSRFPVVGASPLLPRLGSGTLIFTGGTSSESFSFNSVATLSSIWKYLIFFINLDSKLQNIRSEFLSFLQMYLRKLRIWRSGRIIHSDSWGGRLDKRVLSTSAWAEGLHHPPTGRSSVSHAPSGQGSCDWLTWGWHEADLWRLLAFLHLADSFNVSSSFCGAAAAQQHHQTMSGWQKPARSFTKEQIRSSCRTWTFLGIFNQKLKVRSDVKKPNGSRNLCEVPGAGLQPQ